MSKKQKLELTWIGKDARTKLEPRILLSDSEKSYHAKHHITSADFGEGRKARVANPAQGGLLGGED